jgi:hypothetical protein
VVPSECFLSRHGGTYWLAFWRQLAGQDVVRWLLLLDVLEDLLHLVKLVA